MAPLNSHSYHKVLALLAVIVSLVVTSTHASTITRRLETIPYLDYTGIEAAAREAISDTLKRRGVDESDLIARELLGPRQLSVTVPSCKKVNKRKEWRDLRYNEKKDWIRAVKCLQTKGDYGISPISDTLYDAFTQVHQTNWTDFHGNAFFLPWHRWFVWVHAEAMEHECGYSGPHPYWDYTLDYKNPTASPIFSTDPEVGFGTHGNIPLREIGQGGYKVDNGAFANLKVNLPIPHFLTRNFSAWKDWDPERHWGTALGGSFSPEQVKIALKAETFWELEAAIDGLNLTTFNDPPVVPSPDTPAPAGTIPLAGIHNGPHFFNMGDWNGPFWLLGTDWFPAGVVAPNDPMFWPHHTNVDRTFWRWQQRPGKQWEFNGLKGANRTDDPALPTDLLPFYGLGPDVPVALTLKTENWPMCYTY